MHRFPSVQGVSLALALLLATMVAGAAHAQSRYDPRLRFRTISTPRFDVHFHQGEEEQAGRLAELAEEVAAGLDGSVGRPSGRVQVILVDQSDLPNGWAIPLPYNTIEVTAAAPGGESLIGNTTDWLRLVFVHEYTHIVHMSQSRGLFGGLRRIFGRHPLLFPNVFLPGWQIEGIATYQESARTGQGRLYAGDFRAIAERAAATSRFLPLDRANGGLIEWPSGHAPYVYGAHFHEFLAARYGEASLARLTEATARRPPYFGSTAFRPVFGRSLGELWNEFAEEMRRQGAPAEPAQSGDAPVIVSRLTDHGFTVRGPRFGPDGRLFYSVVNPHGFPALMSIVPGAGPPGKVAPRYLGNGIGFAGDVIVFDQLEVMRNVGLQSDLYAVESGGGRAWRLTHDARAADPDVGPDGRTIVCTVQRVDRRELATLSLSPRGGLPGAPSTLISEPDTHFAAPRWSPDGRWIAAERLRTSGSIDVVVIDPRARQVVRTVASPAGRNVTPAWTPDGSRVLFASDRDGGAFRLFSVDLASGETRRLEDTGSEARSPDVDRAGRTLVFVGYTPDGYDLFSMPFDSARWTVLPGAEFEVPAAPVAADSHGVRPDQSRPYAPWRTLAPRFWTPTLESDAGEVVVGAATASFDALGRHAYGVEAGWSRSRARPDWQLGYAYNRWRPVFFANVSDDTDPRRDGTLRSIEAQTGLSVPFQRVRWSHAFLGSLYGATDVARCAACGPDGELRFARRSVRSAWLIDAARSYGYSISEEEGWSLSVTTELDREALGADGNAGAATLDIRGYLPVVPRHGVIAARFASASGWGDDDVRRVFSASGDGPQFGGFRFGADAIGLMRGIDRTALTGRRAVVANLDYRVPFWRIERGHGTWPFFARTVHGAVFADVGHAWDGEFRAADLSRSVGAELSLDAVVGYLLPVTLTAGVAWRHTPADRGAAIFGRIGRAF